MLAFLTHSASSLLPTHAGAPRIYESLPRQPMQNTREAACFASPHKMLMASGIQKLFSSIYGEHQPIRSCVHFSKEEETEEANVTEKPVRDQTGLRSPPARIRSERATTSSSLEAPCYQQQGALHIAKNGKSETKIEVSCDRDFETQEAMRNFQSYLDILREWDTKDQEERFASIHIGSIDRAKVDDVESPRE